MGLRPLRAFYVTISIWVSSAAVTPDPSQSLATEFSNVLGKVGQGD